MADDLYKKKNILISPVSLNMVLGMIANGTVGDISPKSGKGYMVNTVYINPQWGVEQYLGKNTDEYNQYALDRMKETKNSNVLKLANSVWYGNRYKINDAFQNTVEQYYEATVKKVPMNQQTLDEINCWVKDNTDGRIEKLLKKIEPNICAYILNALAFDGKWTDVIQTNEIHNGKFKKFNGKKIKVKMMQCEERKYFENDYATAFEKTYGQDGKYSFIGILPKDKGEFRIENLNVSELLKKEKYDAVAVKFPRFSYQWNGEMSKSLKYTTLFDIFHSAYSPMSAMFQGEEPNGAYVKKILQACKITVNEKGSQAAATTGAAVVLKGVRAKAKKTIVLNRPFAYLIRDNKTGEILFVGKVTDPTAK